MLAFPKISKKIKEETRAREQAANKPVKQAVSNEIAYRGNKKINNTEFGKLGKI